MRRRDSTVQAGRDDGLELLGTRASPIVRPVCPSWKGEPKSPGRTVRGSFGR